MKVSCKSTPKGGAKTTAKKFKAGDPAPTDLLIDNQDQAFTLNGVDSQGYPVDISGVASISASVDDSTVISVDPASGMTVQGHALKPGSATITFVATWNDGSVGPFTVTLPVTVSTGPANSLVVTPGTPTVRNP